jgi:hypothetical protein
MNLPIPSGSGKVSRHLRAVREELRRLRPQRSANLLTSQTTGGVTRTPIAGAGRPAKKNLTARWA